MNERIIHGDTNLVLPQLVEIGVVVDLICTDPPYNVGVHFSKTSRDKMSLNDYIDINFQQFCRYKELLSETGSIIMFSAQTYLPHIALAGLEAGLNLNRIMVWYHKNTGRNYKLAPKNAFDPILWWTKNRKTWTYNKDDVRVPYSQPDRRKYGDNRKLKDGTIVHYSANLNLGAAHTDIWEYPALTGGTFAKEREGHPTQKPEALIKDLIKAFCPKDKQCYNGVVFDPFLGSGTTLACCKKLNLLGHNIEYFGIEIDEDWCAVADKRLSQIGGLP